MLSMGIDEIAEAVSGDIVPVPRKPGDSPVLATSAVADSRLVRPGSIFVAIPGERVDGHDFVGKAAHAGAVAALVEHAVPDAAITQIVVSNSVQALGALARHNIDRRRELDTDFSIIGITGSVGKTTTKDLLHSLLNDLGATVAPVGSFNNDVGLPLTALQVNDQTRYLIAEMGANHVGEIANLTTIAPPDISVVLKVGTAHLGEFGSVEHIAQAKSEIVRGLLPHGTAVLNADDDHVSAMASLAPGEVLWFGEDNGHAPHAHMLTADAITTDALDHPSFTLHNSDAGDSVEVSLAITGRHNVYNALAAATVAHYCGMPLERIAQLLHDVNIISPHRMAVSTITRRAARFTLIDDSFNANPDSMRAGLDGLAAWQGDDAEQHYRVAVLGAMLELGDEETRLHESVGAYAASVGVNAVVAVGSSTDAHLDSLAKSLAHGAEQAVSSPDGGATSVALVHDVDEADRLVTDYAQKHPHTTVLLKGSHASGLSALVDRWSADRDTAVI